jgi:hypothetical protein
VAWTGYKHPELPPLLGTYSKDYQKAQSQTPKRRGARNYAVRTDRLVVEMGGHQRGGNLHGRAYDPTSVPSEVSIDEIK